MEDTLLEKMAQVLLDNIETNVKILDKLQSLVTRIQVLEDKVNGTK